MANMGSNGASVEVSLRTDALRVYFLVVRFCHQYRGDITLRSRFASHSIGFYLITLCLKLERHFEHFG